MTGAQPGLGRSGPEGGRHVVGAPPTDRGTPDADVVDVGGVSRVGQLAPGAFGVEMTTRP